MLHPNKNNLQSGKITLFYTLLCITLVLHLAYAENFECNCTIIPNSTNATCLCSYEYYFNTTNVTEECKKYDSDTFYTLRHEIELYNSSIGSEMLKAINIYKNETYEGARIIAENKTSALEEQMDALFMSSDEKYAYKTDLNQTANNIMSIMSLLESRTNSIMESQFWLLVFLSTVFSFIISLAMFKLIPKAKPVRMYYKNLPSTTGYIEDTTSRTDVKEAIKKHRSLKEYIFSRKLPPLLKQRMYEKVNNSEINSEADIEDNIRIMEDEENVKKIPQVSETKQTGTKRAGRKPKHTRNDSI